MSPLDMIEEKKTGVTRAFERKSLAMHQWLPPLQLQSVHDYLVHSRCSPSMTKSLEEIRGGLILIQSPAFACMKLLHIPGTSGESDAQVALYARVKGWVETMKELGLERQRKATELYAQGHGVREIDGIIKIRNGKARFYIVKGLEEYSKLWFDFGDGKH